MSKAEKNKDIDRVDSNTCRLVTIEDLGFADTARQDLAVGFSTWVRVLMQNWRQGTVACKGRSDVNRTNKKPFKQKGTGRARAGSARSPLWRGGGVIFGPQPRVRTLSLPQKVKHAVLRNVFFDRIEADSFFVADWGVVNKPSTKQAYDFLKRTHLSKNKIVLFVPWEDSLTRASFANINTVRIVLFDQINGFDVVSGAKFLVFKKDIAQFKEVVSQWS